MLQGFRVFQCLVRWARERKTMLPLLAGICQWSRRELLPVYQKDYVKWERKRRSNALAQMLLDDVDDLHLDKHPDACKIVDRLWEHEHDMMCSYGMCDPNHVPEILIEDDKFVEYEEMVYEFYRVHRKVNLTYDWWKKKFIWEGC